MATELWALDLQVGRSLGLGLPIFSLEASPSCCSEATVDAGKGGALALSLGSRGLFCSTAEVKSGSPSVLGLPGAGLPLLLPVH